MFHPRSERPAPITRGGNTRLPQFKIKQILRTVPHNRAFYFYEGIGKPTEHYASSLFEFRDKINAVQTSSLVFHLKRKDFEKWISNIVGDFELARRISSINADALNMKMTLYSTVNTRIKELREMFSSWKTTSENVFVPPRHSYFERSK